MVSILSRINLIQRKKIFRSFCLNILGVTECTKLMTRKLFICIFATLFKAPSTRIRILLKTHLFYPYKKRFASTRGPFSKISLSIRKRCDCDIGNSLFESKIRCSIMIFDIRTSIKENRQATCPRVIPKEPSACSDWW